MRRRDGWPAEEERERWRALCDGVCDVILRGHDARDGQRRERRRAAKDSSRVAWAMCAVRRRVEEIISKG